VHGLRAAHSVPLSIPDAGSAGSWSRVPALTIGRSNSWPGVWASKSVQGCVSSFSFPRCEQAFRAGGSLRLRSVEDITVRRVDHARYERNASA